jgi:hypothetical protein
MGLEMRPKPPNSNESSSTVRPFIGTLNTFSFILCCFANKRYQIVPSPKKRPGLRNSAETSGDDVEEDTTDYKFDYSLFSAKLNAIEEQWCRESMKNPTPLMIEISEQMKARELAKQNK